MSECKHVADKTKWIVRVNFDRFDAPARGSLSLRERKTQWNV
jgi:hypothetical protein